MRTLEAFIPGIRLRSLNEVLSNATRRERFREASTARKQRSDVTLVLVSRFGKLPPLELPVEVTITRHSPGELDGHDNLSGSAKHVTDAIAAWFKVPDKDPGIRWRFGQKLDRHYGVSIRIVGDFCEGFVTCPHCDSKLPCVLDRGHEGPCKPKER